MKLCTFDGRVVLVCTLLYCATAGGAEWGFDANIGIDHSDNLPNAIEAADRKSDGAATLRLSGIVHQQLSENTAIGLNLVADSAVFFRFSGLDNLGVGPRAHLRHKFGLGPESPWTAFSLQALHRDYHYDDRDGWQYNAGVTAGRRIGERWDVSGSVQYDRYEADSLQPAVCRK